MVAIGVPDPPPTSSGRFRSPMKIYEDFRAGKKRSGDVNAAGVRGEAARTRTREEAELRLVKKSSKVRERIQALEDKYSGLTSRGKKVKNKVANAAKEEDKPTPTQHRIVLDPIDPREASSVAELGRLINDTGALLSRNSRLRASLTVSVRAKGAANETATTILLPTPKQARKMGLTAALRSVNGEERKRIPLANVAQSNEEQEDAVKVSDDDDDGKGEDRGRRRDRPAETLCGGGDEGGNGNICQQDVVGGGGDTAASRGRRRSGGGGGGGVPTSRRRSMRQTGRVLTTARLEDHNRRTPSTRLRRASSRKVSNAGNANGRAAAPPVNGDISRIVRALNKLEEDAAKDTAVLRRSLRHKALQEARHKRSKGESFMDDDDPLGAETSPESLVTLINRVPLDMHVRRRSIKTSFSPSSTRRSS